MNGEALNRLIEKRLAERREAGLLRSRREIRIIDATHVEVEGRRCVNFASNNYLGLTHHPRVIAAVEDGLRAGGLGSGASGLVTGHTEAHARAEKAVARWKGMEAAVLLPSGYQAAHAAVQTLSAVFPGEAGVRFLLDKLAHASLIDAVAASRQPYRVFPHNHLEKLERLLADADDGQQQVVITESIFSMDGDTCELAGIAALRRRFGFTLLLDEAHGSGVYGAGGSGYAAEVGLGGDVDVSLVTLSKAVGVSGGAVCGSKALCDAVVNWGRAYIYSTSVAVPVAAGITEAIAVMADEPQRQQRVRHNARRMRALLRERGVAVEEGESPIIPVVLGSSEEAAVRMGERLFERGYLVAAVRPPTVPRGTSRLRVTVSSEHDEDEIRGLVEAVS